jgi:hypothetical protein
VLLAGKQGMSRSTIAEETDSILLPFLQANSELDAQSLLEKLLTQDVDRTIRGIIRQKFNLSTRKFTANYNNPDTEDIYHDVCLQILNRLRQVKANPLTKTINNFRNYVAVTTYNICDEALRQKYPRRWRLKNRLRYLLSHQQGFSLWLDDKQGWLAGFSLWQTQKKVFSGIQKLENLLNHPHLSLQTMLPYKEIHKVNPADLVAAIFNYVGSPIKLDDLVNIAAELWNAKDPISATGISEDIAQNRETHLSKSTDLTTELEQRIYLKYLWQNISSLPLRQRIALLLNMKDENGSGIALFPFLGIATIRQIATTLEMPIEEFAQLWPRLPLDDTAIAEHLGINRQQVINLRKAARLRLIRNMKKFA